MKKRIMYYVGLIMLVACCFLACNDEVLLQEITVAQGADAGNTDFATEVKMEILTDPAEIIAPEVIYVHVCGAVNAPGVYELQVGARINDAVELAGGFDEEADRDTVNLVSSVSDGEQIRIPFIGENVNSADGGLININEADEDTLCEIPGIGASRAGAIVEYRKEHGGFNSPEELMLVPGIKEGIYARIVPYIECR